MSRHYDREKNTEYQRQYRARKRAERLGESPTPPVVVVPEEPVHDTSDVIARFHKRRRELVGEPRTA